MEARLRFDDPPIEVEIEVRDNRIIISVSEFDSDDFPEGVEVWSDGDLLGVVSLKEDES